MESNYIQTELGTKVHFIHLAWDKKNSLSASLMWSKVLFSKTCCNVAKVANIIDQIRFLQPLSNTMYHKDKVLNWNLHAIKIQD